MKSSPQNILSQASAGCKSSENVFYTSAFHFPLLHLPPLSSPSVFLLILYSSSIDTPLFTPNTNKTGGRSPVAKRLLRRPPVSFCSKIFLCLFFAGKFFQTGCIKPTVSDWLHQTDCIKPAASDQLYQTGCTGPSASNRLRRIGRAKPVR